MLAIDVAEEVHVTESVRFCVLLFVYMPVAVNCSVIPIDTDGFAGVKVIETKVGAVTSRVALPLIVPEEALIVVEPCAKVVARPAETVAIAELDEVHVAELVRI